MTPGGPAGTVVSPFTSVTKEAGAQAASERQAPPGWTRGRMCRVYLSDARVRDVVTGWRTGPPSRE